MRHITRSHQFENLLNLVRQGRKYYYIFHEYTSTPTRVPRTSGLDAAFAAEDWDAFIRAEARALGGEAES
jgi:hypothetical protein